MPETSINQPIGIFDSGIGGLTVANAISNILPGETLVYFGDTAHMPYGDKSIELIKSYAIKIAEFLIDDMHAKALVIACNTASAAAYEYLRDTLKGKIPVINVIDPMVEKVIQDGEIKHVGIIATKTTIASGVYQEKLTRRKPGLKFSAMATPLLAPMIEEGFYNDNISDAVLHNYLESPELDGIDSLILACTHYPLIKAEINKYYGGSIKVLDSAEVVAEKLKNILEKENLLHKGPKINPDHFYVSDITDSFRNTAGQFYTKDLKLEYLPIWKSN